MDRQKVYWVFKCGHQGKVITITLNASEAIWHCDISFSGESTTGIYIQNTQSIICKSGNDTIYTLREVDFSKVVLGDSGKVDGQLGSGMTWELEA